MLNARKPMMTMLAICRSAFYWSLSFHVAPSFDSLCASPSVDKNYGPTLLAPKTRDANLQRSLGTLIMRLRRPDFEDFCMRCQRDMVTLVDVPPVQWIRHRQIFRGL
ncbi:hypothetical protein V7S43_017909 [Phytophthora oleae]|uniref:Secreted protein n=1 Tax=Phytophthora oleae TaxID=2107226 RepID=A0ABD3EVW4_9STRA